jgi:histidinol-phosphate/aromatic aminotransferase/cobyric acid decarboxylase-like protein
MRLGLTFASKARRGPVQVRTPTTSSPEQVAAAAALRRSPGCGETSKFRRAEKTLRPQNGLSGLSSQANFVLARRPGENLRGLYEELKRRRVLVRYFDQPGLDDCMRITVGAPDEVRALLEQTAAVIKG